MISRLRSLSQEKPELHKTVVGGDCLQDIAGSSDLEFLGVVRLSDLHPSLTSSVATGSFSGCLTTTVAAPLGWMSSAKEC